MAMYRRQIGNFETVTFRVYAGSGLSQTSTDYEVRARVLGADGSELVGAIGQKDVKLIVLHDDLVAVSYPLPIKSGPNNKVEVRGKEMQIKPGIDAGTRSLKGVPIAYDLTVGG